MINLIPNNCIRLLTWLALSSIAFGSHARAGVENPSAYTYSRVGRESLRTRPDLR